MLSYAATKMIYLRLTHQLDKVKRTLIGNIAFPCKDDITNEMTFYKSYQYKKV